MKIQVGYLGDTWGTVEAVGNTFVFDGTRQAALKGMVAEHQQRHPAVQGAELLRIMLESPQSYVWVREV